MTTARSDRGAADEPADPGVPRRPADAAASRSTAFDILHAVERQQEVYEAGVNPSTRP